MRRCSEDYKSLSGDDRKELAARVQADTKHFEEEMEHYCRAYPQTAEKMGSKHKCEQDVDQGPKRKREHDAGDKAAGGKVAKSAKKIKTKRTRSVQSLQSDSEQSSVAERSEASA